MTRPSRSKPPKRRPLGNLALSTEEKRRVLADFVRSVAPQQPAAPLSQRVTAARRIADALPPRLRQTLDLLLAGDAEKRIALKLGLKQSSIHSYVKELYKRFEVTSRGELLAKFVAR